MQYDQENQINSCSINGDGFEFSPEHDKIIPAFIKMQHELEPAKKTSENPFFRSKYSDLAEVMRVLKEPFKNNGFAVSWFNVMMPYVDAQLKDMVYNQYNKLVWNGKWISIRVREIKVTTLLLHESGQYIKTWLILIPNDNDNQTKGKAITYGKRYSVTSLTGLCSEEDDDGNNVPREEDKKKLKDKTPSSKDKPPVSKKDEYVFDSNKNARYNKTKNKLYDDFQKKNGFIVTADWLVLKALIQKKLGGNNRQFIAWLKGTYKVEFFDIKTEMLAGIKKTIEENADQIMDYGLDK